MSVHAGLNDTFGYFEVTAALDGRLPLEALIASTSAAPAPAGSASPTVHIDNAASESYSVIEVRAPDQVGLLYRTARALSDLGLEIHHAKVSTHPHGALDVFYVWDRSGNKLDDRSTDQTARELAHRLAR